MHWKPNGSHLSSALGSTRPLHRNPLWPVGQPGGRRLRGSKARFPLLWTSDHRSRNILNSCQNVRLCALITGDNRRLRLSAVV
jgi:hypothetical protein